MIFFVGWKIHVEIKYDVPPERTMCHLCNVQSSKIPFRVRLSAIICVRERLREQKKGWESILALHDARVNLFLMQCPKIWKVELERG